MTQKLHPLTPRARARSVPQTHTLPSLDANVRHEIEIIRETLQDAINRCDRLLSVSVCAAVPASKMSSQDAVAVVVNAIYPTGKPLGMRKGEWVQRIVDECKEAGIVAGDRTVRRALGGK